MDQGEQCTDHSVSRQSPSAPVCGETGQDCKVLYQREGAQSTRLGQDLVLSGWEA